MATQLDSSSVKLSDWQATIEHLQKLYETSREAQQNIWQLFKWGRVWKRLHRWIRRQIKALVRQNMGHISLKCQVKYNFSLKPWTNPMCLSFFWVLLCCHHWPHLTMLQKTCLFLLLLPVSRDFTSGITPFSAHHLFLLTNFGFLLNLCLVFLHPVWPILGHTVSLNIRASWQHAKRKKPSPVRSRTHVSPVCLF